MFYIDYGPETVVGCIGDGECNRQIKRILRQKIKFMIKKDYSIFITRGKSGFEANCVEILYNMKKKYPHIRCYAIKEKPDSTVAKLGLYDKIFFPKKMLDYINIPNNSMFYEFLASQTTTFLIGPVSESVGFIMLLAETKSTLIDVGHTLMPNGEELIRAFNFNFTVKENLHIKSDSPKRDYYSKTIDYDGYDNEEFDTPEKDYYSERIDYDEYDDEDFDDFENDYYSGITDYNEYDDEEQY